MIADTFKLVNVHAHYNGVLIESFSQYLDCYSDKKTR